MYPSTFNRPTGQGGLTRYVSAPSTLLTGVVDSVTGADGEFSALGSESLMGRYFSSDSPSITSEPVGPTRGLERSYGLKQMSVGGTGTSPLIRHSSSPAGFLDHLMVDNANFSVSRGMRRHISQAGNNTGHGVRNGIFKSQLSFTGQESLSHISEVCETSDAATRNVGHSYTSSGFSMGSWDDTNSITFSSPPSKRGKGLNGDILTDLTGIDSQFNVTQTSLEMANMEKLLQMQHDSVPCRVRAKRGFATHPRSIAERERRSKISEKLKKLQDLVPNMDKQTSTADMLDFAVQHIKGLQNQVQNLNKDLENCTCGCKSET